MVAVRVTLVMEVDATEFIAARERIKAKVSKDWGFAVGYNGLLARQRPPHPVGSPARRRLTLRPCHQKD